MIGPLLLIFSFLKKNVHTLYLFVKNAQRRGAGGGKVSGGVYNPDPYGKK